VIIGNYFVDQTSKALWVEGENSNVSLKTTLVQDNDFSECVGTIDYDNVCIILDDGDPDDNETLNLSSLLETITDAEGIVIGRFGLVIGALIAGLLIGGTKKKSKKKK